MSDDQAQGGQTQDVDLEKTVVDILGKREPDKAVEKLLKDNFSYRDKLRDLRDEVKALQANLDTEKSKEVDDNTEELAKLAKWQELGEYDDVKANLSRLTEMESDNSLRKIADAAEMNFQVLKDLDRLHPDIVLLLQDGKPVAKKGEDVFPLDDFAKAEWSTYVPSLKQTSGTTYIQQTSSKQGSKGTSNLTDDFIQGMKDKRKSNPNPLMRSHDGNS